MLYLLLQALEKSKYEQSLESVRRFIAIAEKELELYYRHIALYGDPNDSDPKSILDSSKVKNIVNETNSSTMRTGFDDEENSEDEDESSHDLDYEDDGMLSEDLASSDESGDEK